jgi:hypothetical protein
MTVTNLSKNALSSGESGRKRLKTRRAKAPAALSNQLLQPTSKLRINSRKTNNQTNRSFLAFRSIFFWHESAGRGAYPSFLSQSAFFFRKLCGVGNASRSFRNLRKRPLGVGARTLQESGFFHKTGGTGGTGATGDNGGPVDFDQSFGRSP